MSVIDLRTKEDESLPFNLIEQKDFWRIPATRRMPLEPGIHTTGEEGILHGEFGPIELIPEVDDWLRRTEWCEYKIWLNVAIASRYTADNDCLYVNDFISFADEDLALLFKLTF